MAENEQLLTTKELAQHLRLSYETVRCWAVAGKIPGAKIARNARRFRLSEVMAKLEEDQRQGAK